MRGAYALPAHSGQTCHVAAVAHVPRHAPGADGPGLRKKLSSSQVKRAAQSPRDAATIATVQLLLTRVTALESAQSRHVGAQDADISHRLHTLEQKVNDLTKLSADLQTSYAAAKQHMCEPGIAASIADSAVLSALCNVGLSSEFMERLPEAVASAEAVGMHMAGLRQEVQQLSTTSQELQTAISQLQSGADARASADENVPAPSLECVAQAGMAGARQQEAQSATVDAMQRMLENCQCQGHQQNCVISEQGLLVSELQEGLQAMKQQVAQLQQTREGTQVLEAQQADSGGLEWRVHELTERMQDLQSELNDLQQERARACTAEEQSRNSLGRASSDELGSHADAAAGHTDIAGLVRVQPSCQTVPAPLSVALLVCPCFAMVLTMSAHSSDSAHCGTKNLQPFTPPPPGQALKRA